MKIFIILFIRIFRWKRNNLRIILIDVRNFKYTFARIILLVARLLLKFFLVIAEIIVLGLALLNNIGHLNIRVWVVN